MAAKDAKNMMEESEDLVGGSENMSSDMKPAVAQTLAPPTIGRVVHFLKSEKQPYAAIVINVKSPLLIDIVYFRPDGISAWAYDVPMRDKSRQMDCWEWPGTRWLFHS